jgi:putative membrane protein
VTTIAVMVAANVVKGIEYGGWPSLLVASLLLGALNALLRPLLLFLSLPLLVLTLGLFALVINALLLYFVGFLVKGFQVDSFGSAFLGGLLITLTTVVLNTVTGSGKTWIDLGPGGRRKDQSPKRKDPPGRGPIIDV